MPQLGHKGEIYDLRKAATLLFPSGPYGTSGIDPAASHGFLSTTHDDVVVNAASRGALVYGNSASRWDALPSTACFVFLQPDALDIGYTACPHIGDGASAYFGNNQDVAMGYDEAGDDQFVVTGASWFFDGPHVSIGASGGGGAKLSVDQGNGAGNIPALKIDQEDVSAPCVKFSVSGADADIVLWELEVTGTPSLLWDESEDALQFSHALSIRATPALASGLYVPWISGDALGVTAYFGSDDASNNETAVFAISDSAIAIIGKSEDTDGILGITNAADVTANGVKGSATGTGRGVLGTTGPGIGGEFSSGTGYALIANLTGAGSAIVEFRDTGTPVLTIQDGGQADFAEYLRHLGDVDTFWRFQDDRASLDCGGVTFIDAQEAASDTLTLGGDGVVVPDNYTIGLALSGAGQIEFDDQATDEINLLNCNVGINTSTPRGRLEVMVASTDVQTVGVYLTNTYSIVGTPVNAGASLNFQMGGTTGRGPRIVGLNRGNFAQRSALAFYVSNDAAPAEVVRISKEGRLGIGTAAPGSPTEWNFADDDLEFVDAHVASAVGSISGVIEVQRGGATEYIALYDGFTP